MAQIAIHLPAYVRHTPTLMHALYVEDIYPNRTRIQYLHDTTNPYATPEPEPLRLDTDAKAGHWLWMYLMTHQPPQEVTYVSVSRPMATVIAYKATRLFQQPDDTHFLTAIPPLLIALSQGLVQIARQTYTIRICAAAEQVLAQQRDLPALCMTQWLDATPIPDTIVTDIPIRDMPQPSGKYSHKIRLTPDQLLKLESIARRTRLHTEYTPNDLSTAMEYVIGRQEQHLWP